MKALMVKQFGALDSMVLEEVPSPQPGDGEVLVDIRAASVNFPDLLVIQGKYQVLPQLPFSPGKECAGVVKAGRRRSRASQAGRSRAGADRIRRVTRSRSRPRPSTAM